jgi:AbrB family looped-hinge helix DNA binding protein
MVKTVKLVKIDKYGKIFIPKWIRKKLNARSFEVSLEKEKVVLKPIKHPLQLFGTLKDLNLVKLDKMHEEEHELTA